MNEAIYDQQDLELAQMVNANARRRGEPTEWVLVPASQAIALDCRNAKRQQIQRVTVAAGRIGLGLLCIGAMARDMMSPGLAVLAAAACCVWATIGYWRGGNG